jgi:hypothetical protein
MRQDEAVEVRDEGIGLNGEAAAEKCCLLIRRGPRNNFTARVLSARCLVLSAQCSGAEREN